MNITYSSNRAIWAWTWTVLFVIVAFLAKTNSTIIHVCDKSIQAIIDPIRSEAMTHFINAITKIGEPKVDLVLAILILVFLFFKKEYANAIWGFIVLVVGNGLVVVVKKMITRPRPSDKLVAETGFSFPSGHTFGTVLLVLMIIYLLLPRIKNASVKQACKTLLIIWAILIAATRIYLHVHFPSDTIAAALLAGAVWEFGLMAWLHFFNKN